MSVGIGTVGMKTPTRAEGENVSECSCHVSASHGGTPDLFGRQHDSCRGDRLHACVVEGESFPL